MDLFDFVEGDRLGKLEIEKDLFNAVNSVADGVAEEYYYFSNGVIYIISVDMVMAMVLKSKCLSASEDKHVFKLNTSNVAKVIKTLPAKVNKVIIELYTNGAIAGSKTFSRGFKITEEKSKVKVYNPNALLKENDYKIVKVDAESFAKGIRFFSSIKPKHDRAKFNFENGKLYMYDYLVDKNGKFDEVKYVLGNSNDIGKASVLIPMAYLKPLSKIFSSKYLKGNKVDVIIISGEFPMVIRGTFNIDKCKYKYYSAIAPLLEPD